MRDVGAAPPRQRAAPNGARVSEDRLEQEGPSASGAGAARQSLQRGAPSNLRRHLGRAAIRVSVLVVADLSTLVLLFVAFHWLNPSGVALLGLARASGRLVTQLPFFGWSFAAALVLGLAVAGSYGEGDGRRDPMRLLAGCALATVLPLWSSLWAGGVVWAVPQFVAISAVVSTALVLERLLLDHLVSRVFRLRPISVRTVVVTCSRDCSLVRASGVNGETEEFRVVGVLEARSDQGDVDVSRVQGLPHLLVRDRIEAVAACDHLQSDEIQLVADAAMAAGCSLLVYPRAFEIVGVQPKVVWRRGKPLIALTAPGLQGPQLLLKWLLDLFGATVGLVLLSPLMLVVALLVKVTSPGPAFFSQRRFGRGGRPFRIYKFRTMVANAEEMRDGLVEQSVYGDGRLFKIPLDPRVTPIGRLLRRTSVDELPQLWNVIRGEMSLVGPRPPLPDEVALYEAHHYVRFDVKPGITGPWQVAGRNKITDFEQVIALETSYIREWSIWQDLRILARTVAVVLRMDGAH